MTTLNKKGFQYFDVRTVLHSQCFSEKWKIIHPWGRQLADNGSGPALSATPGDQGRGTAPYIQLPLVFSFNYTYPPVFSFNIGLFVR